MVRWVWVRKTSGNITSVFKSNRKKGVEEDYISSLKFVDKLSKIRKRGCNIFSGMSKRCSREDHFDISRKY